ncbi:MAG: anthranilate synthase component I [Actinomycetota bacterium]
MDLTTTPDRDAFFALAQQHPLVPVSVEILGDLETPVGVYRKLGAPPRSFLLESVEHGERWGRFSFIGLEPFGLLTGRAGKISIEGALPASLGEASDPLAALEEAVAAFTVPELPGMPPLHSGAVGYIGYDCIRYIERLPQTTDDDLGLPELWMSFTGVVIAFDHLRQRMRVIANAVIGDDPAGSYDRALEAIDRTVAAIAQPVAAARLRPPVVAPSPAAGDVESNRTPADFIAAVSRAKEAIADGEVFQVVPSQRFRLPTDADPVDVYRVLRLINPSPYMFFLQTDDASIVGSSPEPLIRVRGRQATIRPIAGTRRRGANDEEDDALAHELLGDEKERAEHVMLVDLARNDLGRVCEPGTVRVGDLMSVERYSHVMHIASSVTGTLAEGVGPLEAFRAAFPAGTVTGAPKIRAMELIDALEPTRRGPYAGAVGYIDFSGNLDTCIALRTGYMRDGAAYLQAGAGVVADSDPASEEAETRQKAGAFLAAVRGAQQL